MNNGLSRKYIVISLLVHLALFLIMAYVIHSNRIAKPFVVFGAHSKKPSHAVMKFGSRRVGARGCVPFVGGGRKGGKRAGRVKHRENHKQISPVVAKTPKLRVKKSAPLAIKQEVAASEKLVAMRSGVSIQKEKRAKKLNKREERAARKREERRLEREERELREMEKLLAKREEEERLLEQERKKLLAREVAKKEKKETEKKKELLLAQREKDEHENKESEEIAPIDRENESTGDNSAGVFSAENPEDIGGNGTDVLEFNLLDQSDPELLFYHRNIQREVARLWRPPLGVPKGTTCRMMVMLGADGSVEQAEFVSRSKMLIYDLSVLRIIKRLELDKFLWGKRLIIDFCQ